MTPRINLILTVYLASFDGEPIMVQEPKTSEINGYF